MAPHKAPRRAPQRAPPRAPQGVPPRAPQGPPPRAPQGAPPRAPQGPPPRAPQGAPPRAPQGAPPRAPPRAPQRAPRRALDEAVPTWFEKRMNHAGKLHTSRTTCQLNVPQWFGDKYLDQDRSTNIVMTVEPPNPPIPAAGAARRNPQAQAAAPQGPWNMYIRNPSLNQGNYVIVRGWAQFSRDNNLDRNKVLHFGMTSDIGERPVTFKVTIRNFR
jgi:hypothetical protein